MRHHKTFALGVVFAAALPATSSAQRQGTVEFGAFAKYTNYSDTLRLDPSIGFGGRAGLYVAPRWSLEVDVSRSEADAVLTPAQQTLGLPKVLHVQVAGRALYHLPLATRLKLLAGAGYAYDRYSRTRVVAPSGGGPQGLLGLRFLLNDRVSARLEGTGTYVLPGDDDALPFARPTLFNFGANAGLSVSFFVRPPAPVVQTDTIRTVQRDTVYVTRIDTVRVEVAGRPVVVGSVNFAFNKSDLSSEAKSVLDIIAASFTDPANATRAVTVTGATDNIGSERFNTQLGQARADQAKAYLVSKGIAESRIVARTRGESDPVAPNSTGEGRASNRRVLVMLTN